MKYSECLDRCTTKKKNKSQEKFNKTPQFYDEFAELEELLIPLELKDKSRKEMINILFENGNLRNQLVTFSNQTFGAKTALNRGLSYSLKKVTWDVTETAPKRINQTDMIRLNDAIYVGMQSKFGEIIRLAAEITRVIFGYQEHIAQKKKGKYYCHPEFGRIQDLI